jgi:periplasmic protein TonB
MSTVQPSAPQGSPSRGALSKPRFGLSPRVWWVVAGGFGTGLILFLLLWLDMRDNGDFYRAEDKADSAGGQVFEPLPAPIAGDQRSASGLSEAAEEALRNPPPAPPPIAAPRPVERPIQRTVADATPPNNRSASPLAPGNVPVAISKPAPSYPTDALRNNETGTVLVRIAVGADGEPTDVTLAKRSGSRSLDRAALKAARNWRFRPAQQNGIAVASAVEVPMTFKLDGR